MQTKIVSKKCNDNKSFPAVQDKQK